MLIDKTGDKTDCEIISEKSQFCHPRTELYPIASGTVHTIHADSAIMCQLLVNFSHSTYISEEGEYSESVAYVNYL